MQQIYGKTYQKILEKNKCFTSFEPHKAARIPFFYLGFYEKVNKYSEVECMSSFINPSSSACRISVRGEHVQGVAFVGGPGAEPPGRLTTFENLQKKFSENCNKCIILANFLKFFKSHAFNFRSFGRKTQRLGNCREIFGNF